MPENQNIEYKETWRDEYMRWISGFANAQGGSIFIGIDDKGNVKGIDNIQKLLEDIPNKVRDILGIIVDVNKYEKNNKAYLEIVVEPYPYPINYKGEYHVRSGSTKQELKGAALNKFLLQKQGKRWDGVPIPNVNISDLDQNAFEYFRQKSASTMRLAPADLNIDNHTLLEKLNLFENQYIKRAAILLFHSNPEKYISGAYIKIGYFESDIDLLFQDEVHGSVFSQIERAIDLLTTKYLRAEISYQGISRIERLSLPESVLREAVLNAVAHKDYSSSTPIQISVYKDKIIIYNEGQLPENWTIENLKIKHPSKPYNPDLANVLFRAGLIESWGRGTLKMISECKANMLPEPDFYYDFSGFIVEFNINRAALGNKIKESSPKSSPKSSPIILQAIRSNSNISIKELAEISKLSERAVKKVIEKLKEEGFIRRKGSSRSGYWELIRD